MRARRPNIDPAGDAAHERPLLLRIIDEHMADFVTIACSTAAAGAGNWTEFEKGKQAAISEMRNLHLSGWMYAFTPQLAEALERAGLLRDRSAGDVTGVGPEETSGSD